MSIEKDKSTQENRDFWDFVEKTRNEIELNRETIQWTQKIYMIRNKLNGQWRGHWPHYNVFYNSPTEPTVGTYNSREEAQAIIDGRRGNWEYWLSVEARSTTSISSYFTTSNDFYSQNPDNWEIVEVRVVHVAHPSVAE